ncbi:MAG: hypothetical protein ABEN55_21010 [Bradymonadaceae bacterium]
MNEKAQINVANNASFYEGSFILAVLFMLPRAKAWDDSKGIYAFEVDNSSHALWVDPKVDLEPCDEYILEDDDPLRSDACWTCMRTDYFPVRPNSPGVIQTLDGVYDQAPCWTESSRAIWFYEALFYHFGLDQTHDIERSEAMGHKRRRRKLESEYRRALESEAPFEWSTHFYETVELTFSEREVITKNKFTFDTD